MSYINGLRARERHADTAELTTEEKIRRNEEWHNAETRLANLEQKLDVSYSAYLSQHQCTMVRSTAELYRIATFLYLQRTCNTTQVHEIRTVYLEQAFYVLGTLEVCTSPWPLFVLACEADVDEQRIEILQALDRMDEVRRIGNIKVLRNIVESYWKQHDLQADIGRALNLKWWDVVDLNVAAPWFI